MDPVTIALGLAQFIPSAIRWLSGDDQNEVASVADKIVSVAQAVTGKPSGQDALTALQTDPALVLQFQNAWMAHELGMYQEETKRLQATNATIQAELASNDAYARRMRPTWGYILAGSWGTLMGAIVFRILKDPDAAVKIIEAVAKLDGMWSVALAVLGLHVWTRSGDKRAAMGGGGGLGIMGALAGRIAGR